MDLLFFSSLARLFFCTSMRAMMVVRARVMVMVTVTVTVTVVLQLSSALLLASR